MSDDDLQGYLGTIARVMAAHAEPGQAVAAPDALRSALSAADADGLATATADMDDSRRWLAAVVTQVARTSPSFAVALAAQYAAQRAMLASGIEPAAGATAAVTSARGGAGVAPTILDPSQLLLIDAREGASIAQQGQWHETDTGSRTGLRDALLSDVSSVGGSPLGQDVAEQALRDWCLLTSAAALGVAEAMRTASDRYATERRQFGSAIVGFAGLRAILVEMDVTIAALRAQVDLAAIGSDSDVHLRLSAGAHRASVRIGIDAVQVHGGYGYIDEYPVAGLLRDAISLQARGLPRRSAIGLIGGRRFTSSLEGDAA